MQYADRLKKYKQRVEFRKRNQVEVMVCGNDNCQTSTTNICCFHKMQHIESPSCNSRDCPVDLFLAAKGIISRGDIQQVNCVVVSQTYLGIDIYRIMERNFFRLKRGE